MRFNFFAFPIVVFDLGYCCNSGLGIVASDFFFFFSDYCECFEGSKSMEDDVEGCCAEEFDWWYCCCYPRKCIVAFNAALDWLVRVELAL